VINEDPEKESAVEVLQQLYKLFPGTTFTVKEVLSTANDEIGKHPVHPELHDALMAACGGDKKIEPRRLGWWMRGWRDRFAGGFKLVRANSESKSTAEWKVESA
jgi:hypothetical protein